MNYRETDLTVKQGDTVALSYATDPEQDMTGWEARVMVKRQLTGTGLIDMTITDQSNDGLRIIGLLDTAPLSPDNYWLLAELSNAGTGESKEIHNRLTVEQQGVF